MSRWFSAFCFQERSRLSLAGRQTYSQIRNNNGKHAVGFLLPSRLFIWIQSDVASYQIVFMILPLPFFAELYILNQTNMCTNGFNLTNVHRLLIIDTQITFQHISNLISFPWCKLNKLLHNNDFILPKLNCEQGEDNIFTFSSSVENKNITSLVFSGTKRRWWLYTLHPSCSCLLTKGFGFINVAELDSPAGEVNISP